VRPHRIGMVIAKIGDSAESIVAARMPNIDQGRERFLVINGLSEGELPIPGLSYKIITN
jgi:predicted Zn-dependent protease